MFDLKLIRENPEAFDVGMARRGLGPVAARLIDADAERRACQTELQQLQKQRNDASKQIGAAKSRGEDADAIIAEVSRLKEEVQRLEEEERRLVAALEDELATLPNIPDDSVPDGADEDDNVLLREVGVPPTLDFEPREHFDLGEALGQMDFDAAARMSGARFVVLRGGLARLQRALGDFMLDVHTGEFGYQEVSPPVLVRDAALFGTGQLPKFADDLFRTDNGFWMIPTAEVSLTNLVREQIIDADDLPLRFTALTPCFRSEAGSAGKDTRGMIRQHQFDKVEMVSITRAEDSEAEHERMTGCAEEILTRLGLAYRVMTLCAGDMGFSARKTYDLEVWLPGQNRYREISSCSNCGDFQALRMQTRYRSAEDKKSIRAVHTLNGSGVAVGRCLVAVMENYQQADGSIVVPEVLRPYMGGLDVIVA